MATKYEIAHTLDQLNAELSRRLDDLLATGDITRGAAECISGIGEWVASVADAIRRCDSVPTSRPCAPKSQFLRVVEVLLANGNEPLAAGALQKGAGVSHSALSQILYRSHRQLFASRPAPGYSRRRLWSLTEEAVRRLDSTGLVPPGRAEEATDS